MTGTEPVCHTITPKTVSCRLRCSELATSSTKQLAQTLAARLLAHSNSLILGCGSLLSPLQWRLFFDCAQDFDHICVQLLWVPSRVPSCGHWSHQAALWLEMARKIVHFGLWNRQVLERRGE